MNGSFLLHCIIKFLYFLTLMSLMLKIFCFNHVGSFYILYTKIHFPESLNEILNRVKLSELELEKILAQRGNYNIFCEK